MRLDYCYWFRVKGDAVAEKREPDEGREKRDEESQKDQDDYAPAVLKEGPRRYRFEDWALI